MGRPAKNSADFFSHDSGMRNHRKIKALRNKFGIAGYAIWCMFLEHLTGSDGNEFEMSETEIELLAGDFGVTDAELKDVLSFCIKVELLFEDSGFVGSESLNERLAPVYQKRGRAKEFSKKQLRSNGKFTGNNTGTNGVSVTEKPQSKVKEIKVKEINNNALDFYETPEQAFEEIKNDEIMVERLLRVIHNNGFKSATALHVIGGVRKFILKESAKPEFFCKPRDDIKSHLVNWISLTADKIHTYG